MCVSVCVFVTAGLLHAENAELALHYGLKAPGPQLLLLVSAQRCPLTPVLVHQPERNVALTSAVNVLATFLHPKAHISASTLKKTRLDRKIRSDSVSGSVCVCV